jgi:hypothetical protein
MRNITAPCADPPIIPSPQPTSGRSFATHAGVVTAAEGVVASGGQGYGPRTRSSANGSVQPGLVMRSRGSADWGFKSPRLHQIGHTDSSKLEPFGPNFLYRKRLTSVNTGSSPISLREDF